MTQPLHLTHCRPLEGGSPMTGAEIQAQLKQLSDWQLVEGALQKTFAFANYFETMAFVNALAWVCHQEDHHPDLLVSYNRCTARFNTHSVQGISINDFVVASRADHLLPLA